MHDLPILWALASRFPALFTGSFLHQSALGASSAGRYDLAQRLYQAAAEHYREDLQVEAMARLRTHQLITRARSGSERTEANVALEIERRLRRLDTIESLVSPYALIPAHALLAAWRAPSGVPVTRAPRRSTAPPALVVEPHR
ncbi:MAG TPA: hypothetical protein VEY91_03215 [Candidatus Limnocylindria bacterium]|nr:hypothetical protein [Candidatus Limnocylindria bacterium]